MMIVMMLMRRTNRRVIIGMVGMMTMVMMMRMMSRSSRVMGEKEKGIMIRMMGDSENENDLVGMMRMLLGTLKSQ